MKKLKKILLIDDSNAVNIINKSLLNELGFSCDIISYSNAKEAIKYLDESLEKDKEDFPDIIFLDINMPEMDGFHFLDEYIKIEEIANSYYEPLVVIVSDYLEFENFDRSKRYKSYGVLDHIKKPMDKEDVLSLIDEHFSE